MGLLARAIRADASWAPWDDRWYTPYVGIQSDAGIALSADTITKCGVVLAALRFLANGWALCPPRVGEFMPTGARQMTPDHYAQITLENPNPYQTGFRWRQQNILWCASWGNAYNEIIPGPRSFADELRPLHPGRTRIIDQRADGTLVYEYKPLGAGQRQIIGQERMLHFRGISLDGYGGVAVYQLIRNAVGIALAAEVHVSNTLKRGTRLSGILTTPQSLTKDVKDALRDSWNTAFSGVQGEQAGGVAVLGSDFKFMPMSMDNEKMQLLDLKNHQVEDILRFLGVLGVSIGYQGDKTSTHAAASVFSENAMIHSVLPWIVNFEQEEEKALLLDGDQHFIKHDLDEIQRAAKTKDRYDALLASCGGPFQTRNEVREIEGLDQSDDPGMDEILTPTQVSVGAEPAEPLPALGPPPSPGGGAQPPALKPAPADNTDALAGRAHQFALDAAARVVRREVAAIKGVNGGRGAAVRFAKDPAGWRAWVEQTYEAHVALVAETLHVPEAAARAYCAGQRAALLEGGAGVAETWEATVAPRLAQIALEA